jgi:cytidine deaminase
VLEITVAELCERAEAALNPQDLGAFHVADVGCAVVAEDGSVHTGACIGGYLGLCAEQSALSAVVAQGPPRIVMLAAVWRDPGGALHALPPCGRCREFLRLLSQSNLEADVVLGLDHVVKLKDLLPSHGWSSQVLWSAAGGSPEVGRSATRTSPSRVQPPPA